MGCSDGRRTVRYPPPSSGMPAPGASITPGAQSSAPPPPVAPPPPPPVTFSELPALVFKPGPALRPQTLAPGAGSFIALSPDGRSAVVETDAVRLFTPSMPQGMVLDARVPSAVFTADGTRLLSWGFGMSELSVVDVATGRVLAKREGEYCAARFLTPDQVVFHDTSLDGTARLSKLDVSTGRVTPLSLPHSVEYCTASADGHRWLTDANGKRAFIDGVSGQLRPLAVDEAGNVVAAVGAARYCLASEKGFDCVRVPDSREEHVWKKPTSDTMYWDPDGAFALITFVDNPEGVYSSYAWVDFAAMTVRELRGIKGRSGSLFQIHPGGQVISIGSGSGVYAYDLARGRVHFAAHSPLYSNDFAQGQPRRIVAVEDDSGKMFTIDVP